MSPLYRVVVCAAVVCGAAPADELSALRELAPRSPGIVLTQSKRGGPSRIVLLGWSGVVRELTGGFSAAADPEVSFDGRRILFAGKKRTGDRWQIYELGLDGGEARQVTRGTADCRQPVYQSRVFTLDAPEPWDQAAYVSEGSLHSVKLDGSWHQRLTYAPGGDFDPLVLEDGRMIFSSRSTARPRLFGVNLDGTDYALFAAPLGANPRMAAATPDRRVVFVEGAGQLASVSLDRPLHSYRPITQPGGGAWQTPSALPGGQLLVSRASGPATLGVFRLDPATGKAAPLFDSPEYDDVQAKLVAARALPDGRGSVVDEREPTGGLYCLSAYTTDAPRIVNRSSARRLRVVSGDPAKALEPGDVALEEDGSFHLQIPANRPVKIQLLNGAGALVRSCGWIWVRNRENRGCIGCHEDPELTPENREAKAIVKKPVALTGGGRP
ncbi:MAG: hypothetical protein HY858_02650 [Candidatus Solibacter usitatus]|nr:hypothetical protein [Candidatus Solibacter usitatus]